MLMACFIWIIILSFSVFGLPALQISSNDQRQLVSTNQYIVTQRTVAGSKHWQSVASSSDGTKLAAAVMASSSATFYTIGYIYTSTDSGNTWTHQTAAGSRFWQSITSSSDGTKLFAVEAGDYGYGGGYVYRSTDSGLTWTQLAADGSRLWYSIASNSDGTHLVAVVALSSSNTNGYVYTSTDFGVTWTQQTAAGSNWFSVSANSDGSKFIALSSSRIYYTSVNYGVTWTQQTPAGLTVFSAIAANSDGSLLAAFPDNLSSNDYIYTSSDSGTTFTPQTAAGSRLWRSITMSNDGSKIAAVVNDGYLYTFLYAGPTTTCSAGSYIPTPAGVSCVTCPAGYYCPASSTLQACAAGTYSYTTSAVSSSTCLQCPLGDYSPVGSHTCYQCPAGAICPNGQYSGKCRQNTYASAGAQSCQTCPVGSYTSDGISCNECPTHSGIYAEEYVTDDYTSKLVCKACTFPKLSNAHRITTTTYLSKSGSLDASFQGYDTCTVYGFGASSSVVIAVLVSMAGVFILSLFLFIRRNVIGNLKIIIGLLAYIAIPFADHLTDLLYIMANDFDNILLFIFMIIFFLAPYFLFARELYRESAYAKFRVLSMPQSLLFDRYESFPKTVITCIIAIPFVLINLPFLLPWYLLGSFLFISKALAITAVSDAWYTLWTGITRTTTTTEEDENGREGQEGNTTQSTRATSGIIIIDKSALNSSLLVHALFETTPILIIQIINSTFLGTWDAISIASITFSILNAATMLYRIGYYRIYHADQHPTIDDIPVDLTIAGLLTLPGAEHMRERKDVGSGWGGGVGVELNTVYNTKYAVSTDVLQRLEKLESQVHLLIKNTGG